MVVLGTKSLNLKIERSRRAGGRVAQGLSLREDKMNRGRSNFSI